MIILFVLMCLAGLVAGYVATGFVLDLNHQRVMNSMRVDVGLPTKPYTIRRNN